MILEELEKTYTEEQIEEGFREYEAYKREKTAAAIKTKIETNLALVGKYYKRKVSPHNGMFSEMWKYYKIISNYSTNEYHVSALIFHEYPCYIFNYKISRIPKAENGLYGYFDFDGIFIDDVFIDNLENMIEISKQEYDEALDLYIDRLLKMDWNSRVGKGIFV